MGKAYHKHLVHIPAGEKMILDDIIKAAGLEYQPGKDIRIETNAEGNEILKVIRTFMHNGEQCIERHIILIEKDKAGV